MVLAAALVATPELPALAQTPTATDGQAQRPTPPEDCASPGQCVPQPPAASSPSPPPGTAPGQSPYPYVPPGPSPAPVAPGYYWAPPGSPPPMPYREPEAVAQSPARLKAGAREHDGFFLQMQAGVGGFLYKPTPQRTPSGAGGALDVSVGYALTPRWVLFGGVSMVEGETADSGPKYRSVLFGFTGNVAYYLPSNFFVGGGIGLGGISASDVNKSSDGTYPTIGSTKPGLFAKVQAGREWWVSDNWALGAAVRVSFVRATEKDAEPYAPVWTGGTAGVLFSATFN